MTRPRLRRATEAAPVAHGRAGRSRVADFGLAALAALALVGLAELSGGLDSLERSSVSTRFALRHVPPPTDIVIVKIDDRTFGELGKPWPLSRSLHARVIDRLHAAGAREIVYDVQFTEPRTAAEDTDLYDAIGAAGGVTLATSQSDAQGRTNVLGGDANLARVHAKAAAANLTTSDGGVITHFPYEVSHLKSLAVVAAERGGGKRLSASQFPGGDALIDYRGGAGTFRSVPFWLVLRGGVPASVFRGKIVVVGATAPSLQDLHATPTSGSDLMPGPEVQANAIWTALRGNPLASAPGWLAVLMIFVAALVAPLAALRLSLVGAALTAVVVGAAHAVAAQLAFNAGVVIAVTGPLAACALGIAGMLTASYYMARSEGRVLGWAVRRRTEQLRDAQFEVIARLAQAAESRDGDTGEHIHRIGYLCERLALRVGVDAARAHMLRYAAALHDVGKIGIPDNVLLKPGALDRDEWSIMQSHAVKGAEILAGSTSPLIQMAETIARTHHERWDGTGYPSGLAGEEIPLEGRICAICDVYDALGSTRPYKDAWPTARVLEEIALGSGSHFDPALVAAFLELVPQLDQGARPEQRDDLDLDSLPPLFETLSPPSRAPSGTRSSS
jgi:CHASE2 domain-containing sensor protein